MRLIFAIFVIAISIAIVGVLSIFPSHSCDPNVTEYTREHCIGDNCWLESTYEEGIDE